MNQIKSICTIATKNCLNDLKIFLYSLELVKNKLPIVILCDAFIPELIELKENYHLFPDLKDYGNITNKNVNEWRDLMSQKCVVCEKAIKLFGNVLFLDCDICILQNYEEYKIGNEDLIVNRHNILENIEKQYGMYNAGWLFVSNLKFIEKWKNEILMKSEWCTDQKCLDYLILDFKYSKSSTCHNMGWWRIYQNSQNRFLKRIGNFGGKVCLDSDPIFSVHTHFIYTGDNLNIYRFNTLIMDLLKTSNPKLHDYILNLGYIRKPIEEIVKDKFRAKFVSNIRFKRI